MPNLTLLAQKVLGVTICSEKVLLVPPLLLYGKIICNTDSDFFCIANAVIR